MSEEQRKRDRDEERSRPPVPPAQWRPERTGASEDPRGIEPLVRIPAGVYFGLSFVFGLLGFGFCVLINLGQSALDRMLGAPQGMRLHDPLSRVLLWGGFVLVAGVAASLALQHFVLGPLLGMDPLDATSLSDPDRLTRLLEGGSPSGGERVF